MPTSTLDVFSKNGDTEQTRCLIDSCSQQTFISRKLVNKLKLDIIKDREELSISSFVRSESVTQHFETVTLFAQIGGKSEKIVAVIIDNVAQAKMEIPGLADIIKQLKSTGKFIIADRNINSDIIDNIDILLGADYIHLIHKGIIHIGAGIAIQTPNGIALMGDISSYSSDDNKNI